ncbi:MAG: hypothetical protein ACSHYA_11360 [Opitutaceae bacterium]
MKLRIFVISFFAILALFVSLSAQSIEFTKDHEYYPGPLHGQRGWIAHSMNISSVRPEVLKTGTVEMKGMSQMVLDVPLKLEVGMAYGYTVAFELKTGSNEVKLSESGAPYHYILRTGFTTNNDCYYSPTKRTSCEISLQLMQNQSEPSTMRYRLLDKDYGVLTLFKRNNIESENEYKISFSIEIADSPESTFVEVSIDDGFYLQEGKIKGIEPKLYEDLTSGDGAYLFLQTGQLKPTGFSSFIIKSISE